MESIFARNLKPTKIGHKLENLELLDKTNFLAQDFLMLHYCFLMF